jgi:hypothetical protein
MLEGGLVFSAKSTGFQELKVVKKRSHDLEYAEFRRRADEELESWKPVVREIRVFDDEMDSSDLPEDAAVNHDHYLYGTSKKW